MNFPCVRGARTFAHCLKIYGYGCENAVYFCITEPLKNHLATRNVLITFFIVAP